MRNWITAFPAKLSRYGAVLLLIFLAAVYGFVLYRTMTLNNAQPDSAQVSADVQAASVPHIDPTALKQVRNLQDNSVSVQALFNEATSGPFQE